MIGLLSVIFIFLGVLFILVGAFGIVRMPDIFLRMSASTKTTIIGSGFMLIGVSIFFGDLGVTGRAVAIFAFLLATAPVSAHMIGRAAYSDGVPLCDQTVVNDLEGMYDDVRETLSSGHFGESDTWQANFIDDHGV
ncbi:MAG: monovalent cation/H(+) antiporter subunit G [Chloroflexota bacterium]